METKLNTPDFSRGEMKKQDYADVLTHINQTFKTVVGKKLTPQSFSNIEHGLYKEKATGHKNISHEKLDLKKEEVVTIILCSDPGMSGAMNTHMSALNLMKARGKGYVQKIYGKFQKETPGESKFVHIGDMVVGVYPDTSTAINSTEDKKEVKINEEQFA